MRSRTILTTLAALCILSPFAVADSLFFKDGRYYEVPKLVDNGGDLQAVFGHGTITIAKDLVKDYHIESGGGQIEARSEEDAEKIAKGLVPYEGNWIPKARRDQLVQKRNEEQIARLEEYKKHQKWRDRYQESTRHFEFEFTVPADVGQDYMNMFEVYYEIFAKEWKIKQPAGKKLKVCFYNDRNDFVRIGNVSRGVLGYFRFVEPIELNFFYERRDERLTLDVLFHELNHYLFFLHEKDNWQISAWADEGMAEYYGASKWDPTSQQMSVGHLQEGRLVRLMDEIDGGNMQDLRGLMCEPSISAIQYAWAWSLCHLLMEKDGGKAYRAKFKKYIDKMAKGRAEREPNPRNMNYMWVKRDYAIDQFQKMLGIKDLDAFEQEWYEYIRQLNVVSARGYHEAALFCKRWDRPLRAGVYFKKAIEELYSDNPNTYLEYGRLLIEGGEDLTASPKEAIEVLLKGLKLDPMNPYMYHELGEAYRDLGSQEDKEKGKNYQLLAIEMDPYDRGLLSGLDSEVLAEVGS